MGYADDLDRFIEGQIGFDEIQSFRLQQKIRLALQNGAYYSEREHDLYEKLCYAEVLRSMKFDNGEEFFCNLFIREKWMLSAQTGLGRVVGKDQNGIRDGCLGYTPWGGPV